jgi:tetratricopeptide (TPR) repeat protein
MARKTPPQDPEPRRALAGSRLQLVAFAAALVVTFVAFSPALQNDFVNWDDDAYVVNSSVIKDLSPENIRDFFTEYHHGLYQPLTLLSLALDYAAGGLDPFVYHLVNVLLHLINTGLVFALVYLLAHQLPVALLAAALFGVHPLHVESVAWVTERKDVLYGAFFLASLIAYVRYVRQGQARHYAWALVLFLLSLLAKAQAVSLAITLFVIDFWFDRSLRDRKVLLEKAPFLVLALVFGMTALSAQASAGALSGGSATRLIQRLAHASYGLVSYVVRLVAPTRLSAIYPYPEWGGGSLSPKLWVYPLVVLSGFAAVVFALKHSKALFFGVAFFVINIGLMLQVVPAGTAFMADRFSYLPSVGFFFLIGMGYHAVATRSPRLARPLQLALLAYVALLGALTFHRTQVWRDSLSLWNDVLGRYPEVPFALNNRGIARYASGDVEGAVADYERAIELQPDYSKPYENRGNARLALGQYREAIADYDMAIRLDPSQATTHFNRGLARDYLGDPASAIWDYDEALSLAPDFTEAYYSRGGARANTGDLAGAIDDYSQAIQLDPTVARSFLNRGVVKFAVGDTTGACQDWTAAARLGSEAAIEQLREGC